MAQFSNVLKEFKKWLLSFKAINMLLPYAMYIMFGSLGLTFLYRLTTLVLHKYFSIFNILTTVGHFGFLLGFWLVLIAKECKYSPYGLLLNAIINLFPFTNFSLYTLIYVGMYIFFGYWLYKFTALYPESQ